MIESPNYKIPKPYLFNPFKHHLFHQLQKLIEIKDKNLEQFAVFEKFIGNSQMDLYVGKMNLFEIIDYAREYLGGSDLVFIKNYKQWIFKEGDGFQIVEYPDKTNWIFRYANNPKRYIHIHPGRNCPNTIRIKANTLKTIISIIFEYGFLTEMPSIEQINDARDKYLMAPPIESMEECESIQRNLILFATSALSV